MTEPPLVGQGRRPAVKRPWPRLPRWFAIGAVVALVAFVAVAVVAVVGIARFTEQPLYERRSPSLAGQQSHTVGRVTLPEAPLAPVDCGVVRGLRVQGGPETGPLLTEVLRGLCKRIAGVGPYGARLADRIVLLARQGAVVSFANFGRTGELTTTVAGSPPRVLVSDAFLRGGGQFKGFLLPELAHELWHAGSTDLTAEDELLARKVELAACADIPGSEAFRGCTDAKRIVDDGDAAALAALRAAGYR
ncbi:MAG TPA: hypothetical protein VFQ85_07900 [Mycobacteriales bacterium]|nr:hypothetical protein [Mycobacteriales bacterium]